MIPNFAVKVYTPNTKITCTHTYYLGIFWKMSFWVVSYIPLLGKYTIEHLTLFVFDPHFHMLAPVWWSFWGYDCVQQLQYDLRKHSFIFDSWWQWSLFSFLWCNAELCWEASVLIYTSSCTQITKKETSFELQAPCSIWYLLVGGWNTITKIDVMVPWGILYWVQYSQGEYTATQSCVQRPPGLPWPEK